MSANRAEVCDQNFTKLVRVGQLPAPHAAVRLAYTSLTPEAAVDLFDTQVMSRHLDDAAHLLKSRDSP